MLKMGMTHHKIDTQVLAEDLERLFSGVLLADPQENSQFQSSRPE